MPHFGLTHDACQKRRPVAPAPAEPLPVLPPVLPTTPISSRLVLLCLEASATTSDAYADLIIITLIFATD
ncbi:uncharacterized protein PgNI_03191 [Pyricularia grisea]|uniref:Uncharacterized protein n=1 Tax=Pyricularia grisea TaxID=148305 RepID=A0A6P8B9C0_PYRGI|nr:uncharacterized protein PgNI_03191 [Pyricularia grisea]TLD12424.1 hypothetical protein PgNI_03191 [Pyricularia grisea]